jgi:hypothetical protein
MQITSAMPENDRKRFKLVRTDSLADIPGLIIEADDTTGRAKLRDAGAEKLVDLGPHGFRIMPVSRYDRFG